MLVVDDLEANVSLLTRLLSREGYRVVAATSGVDALAAVARDKPDLVLLDVMMPGMTGFEVCARLKADRATRLLPVVLVTGLQGRDDRVRGIEVGADDFLSKPVDPSELTARVRSLVRLKRYTDELESAESLVVGLALTIEARDAYTQGHCGRLAEYAVRIGRRCGLDDQELHALERGGYLHDVGKIAIPDAILLKPGPLTEDEFDVMRRHAAVGDALCAGFRSLGPVRPIVRHHHERLDGSGYPDSLRGDEIPLVAQIIGIVDVYDALTTRRSYREALPRGAALEEIAREVERGWRQRDLLTLLEQETRPESS